MSKPVKRGYSSALRAAQARETRRKIVSTAAQLFVDDGYGASTIDAIADAAGVSRKTVFSAAGGKVDLLKLAIEWAVAGDDAPVAVVDRDAMRTVLGETDATALLRSWASVTTKIDARSARLFQALEIAAGTDVEARALAGRFERRRLDGARLVITRLTSLNALSPRLKRGEAVDLAWLSTDPVLYDRLVRVRNWSASRFEKWLGDSLCRQLVAT